LGVLRKRAYVEKVKGFFKQQTRSLETKKNGRGAEKGMYVSLSQRRTGVAKEKAKGLWSGKVVTSGRRAKVCRKNCTTAIPQATRNPQKKKP